MQKADKILAETAKQNNHAWTLCPLAMKRNYTKQLCVCVAVYELVAALLALEPALPEEEIPKHVRSTQYQFKVLKDVNCFVSLCSRHLDKAGRWNCFVILLCNVRREM